MRPPARGGGQPPPVRYACVTVKKIIRELLLLLWKFIRTVVWKWLKGKFGTIAKFALIAVIAIVGIVLLAVALGQCG